jgi:hypothetical protein
MAIALANQTLAWDTSLPRKRVTRVQRSVVPGRVEGGSLCVELGSRSPIRSAKGSLSLLQNGLRFQLTVVRVSNRERDAGHNSTQQCLGICRKNRANIVAVVAKKLRSFDLLNRLALNLQMLCRIRERSCLSEKARPVTLSENRYSWV